MFLQQHSPTVSYSVSTAMETVESCSSFPTMATEKSTAITTAAELLLQSIAEIIEFVACIEVEQEAFAEIGCYFHRASPVIVELVETENKPENVLDILQSLSRGIDVAKNLVQKCRKDTTLTELTEVIKQLEGVIKRVGEDLSLIPKSTFLDQEYAEIAVRSLAGEMQNVHFEVSEIHASQMIEAEASKFHMEEQKHEVSSIGSDLYPVSIQISRDDLRSLDNPLMTKFLKNAGSITQNNFRNSRASTASSSMMKAQFVEPLYESFFCPLTKQVMDDPVTIENGMTFERKAITEWFEELGDSDETLCPVTGQKLLSKDFKSNIALKTTIDEWKERNEAARIKVHREALSSASSATTVIEAITDLQGMCEMKWYTKIQVRNAGIAALLVKLLGHKDREVICAALKLLQQLAEGDDDAKEMIMRTKNISAIVKVLSSSTRHVSHAALNLLLELSRSYWLCEEIGTFTGGILILIRMKYNASHDTFSAEKATEILKNLESHPQNVRYMAENGFLEPLVEYLTEGSEEIQMEMAGYLGEIALGHDGKTYVAERASPALIQMVRTGNCLARKAAFQALVEISSYQPNAKVLAEAGILQVMFEEILSRRIYNEPMNSNSEAAAILANILESNLEFENLHVFHGHMLTSDYILSNIIGMIKNTTPDNLNINLIRILLCLTKSPKSIGTIVSIVKETEASYALTELINNPIDELVIGAIKLLMALAPYMGHTIVERLCKTRGQPENLIISQIGTTQITEKQAVSAKFLAKLPHQNLMLNLALSSQETIMIILQTINQIQRSGTRTSRYSTPCLEGLVGVLVRFTTSLYESSILFMARNYNFTLLFTELLTSTSSDEVQRLSAVGLENLSMQSINLSEAPQLKKSKSKLFRLPKFLSSNSRKESIKGCPVHRGLCSSQNTFCLIEAKAVEKLMACLDHRNVEVIEAALSAVCTLLDDKVDLDGSFNMLTAVNAIHKILNVVKEHREEGLQEKSFWIIERFLMKGGEKSANDISQDRFLSTTLVSAFHHGDSNTRQMAEKILRHLNKVPNLRTSYHSM